MPVIANTVRVPDRLLKSIRGNAKSFGRVRYVLALVGLHPSENATIIVMSQLLPTRTSITAARRSMPSFLRLTWNHLWLLGALTLVGVTITLAPTPPGDFWWHLKAGQIIAEQGIPHTNLFAWALPPDQPYVYGEWLAEWLIYRLYQVAGLAAPVLARNLLGLAAFGLVGLAARLRSGSWPLAALAIVVAGAMAINNLSTRPQNWSWLPFAVFALLLSAFTAGRLRPAALLVLPII